MTTMSTPQEQEEKPGVGRTARCSACGRDSRCHDKTAYPVGGWVIPFDALGYYGGFSDEMDVLLGMRISRQWILCHDCIVELLSAFPALAATLGNALHNCDSDTPCCDWAYRMEEGVMLVAEEGRWRQRVE